MYTSTGFKVERRGRTSEFKTPAAGDYINDWKSKQKEIQVDWPTDRKDVAPNRKNGQDVIPPNED